MKYFIILLYILIFYILVYANISLILIVSLRNY